MDERMTRIRVAPMHAFWCVLMSPLRKGYSHLTQRLNPQRVAFAVVWGLYGWQASEKISERIWALRRARDVKITAHTEQQKF